MFKLEMKLFDHETVIIWVINTFNSTSSSMDQIENFSDQSRTFNSNGELVGAKMVGLDENIGL